MDYFAIAALVLAGGCFFAWAEGMRRITNRMLADSHRSIHGRARDSV